MTEVDQTYRIQTLVQMAAERGIPAGLVLPALQGRVPSGAERVTRVLSREEFTNLLMLLGRNEGPGLLWNHYLGGNITRETLTAVIGDVWSSAEYPERYLGRQAWLILFQVAGYTEDGHTAGRPIQPVTLYRGSTPGRAHGMAWTASPGQARWFADRFGQFADDADWARPSFVYTSEVPPPRLLCRIHDPENGRGEDEFVVDAAGLKVRRWRDGSS